MKCVYVCVCVYACYCIGQLKILYSYEKSLLPSLNVSWLKDLDINYVQLDFFQGSEGTELLVGEQKVWLLEE